ncbi:MAG: hypothetical protein EBU93_01380 [Chlamydiae bacterium]|nr:hypothetical protein [Chlamydiota bacterium]
MGAYLTFPFDRFLVKLSEILFISKFMPALPEVEAIKTHLVNRFIGKQILNLKIDPSIGYFKNESRLVNQKIVSIFRLGQYLFFCLSSSDYFIFDMKGKANVQVLSKQDPYSNGHLMSIFFDENYRLDFQGNKPSNRFMLSKNFDAFEAKLGLDPISDYFTYSHFKKILEKKSNSSIKRVLLDQSVIAGINEPYARKICEISAINPGTKIKELHLNHEEKVYHAIKEVLKQAVSIKSQSIGLKFPY